MIDFDLLFNTFPKDFGCYFMFCNGKVRLFSAW